MRCMLSVGVMVVTAAYVGSAAAAPPSYTIVDIGLVDSGDDGSQAFGISQNGIATGRSLGRLGHAYSWTQSGGLVALPNLVMPPRPFCVGNGVNNDGTIVGVGTETAEALNPLPLVWENGVVSQLPLPDGQTCGHAFAINNLGVAVGSVGSGVDEIGVIYDGGTATEVKTLTGDGSYLLTAFGINDSGIVVGVGINPNNESINVGFLLDTNTNTAISIGSLEDGDGSIPFAISNAGYVVGASTLGQSNAVPMVWTEADGMTAIPLPPDTFTGQARGVNNLGWVVGTAGGAFAVPFLSIDGETYVLQDLIPDGSGWDLSMNTSASAFGVSDDGVIVGTGVLNGDIRAYAMIPVPSCEGDLNFDDEVGGADLGLLLGSWGPCAGCAADLDGNGVVDGADLGILLGLWGPCPG